MQRQGFLQRPGIMRMPANQTYALRQVMGVITRKDIAEANAKLALGRKANLGLTTPSDRLVRHGSLPFIPYGAYDPTVGYSASRCLIRLPLLHSPHTQTPFAP